MQLNSQPSPCRSVAPSFSSTAPNSQPRRTYPRLAAAFFSALTLLIAPLAQAAPDNFSAAKRLLREHVYADQNLHQQGTFYCGCDWRWEGKSGGRIDQASCGFQTSSHTERANRLEWEHVMPASMAGQHRQCWRNGGRSNCQKTDPVFNQIEADMHNLVPSIGAVNALRSNTPFGMVSGASVALGQCTTKVGSQVRSVEPRDEVKGAVARIMFYMADRYNIRLGNAERTLIAWDRQYPVSAWELERDRRIAYSMGHHNEFVTGAAQWVQGYRPRGLANPSSPRQSAAQATQSAATRPSNSSPPVYANKRSGLYHLPSGCPGYNQIAANNRLPFSSEAAAISAGYRKASNCR